jgi:hypothetical protein
MKFLVQRPWTGGRRVTLQEARAGEHPAFWRGSDDEFMLEPEYGIVWWRPVGPGRGDVLGRSWRMVERGKPLPREGWRHEPGCTCPLCD